MPRDYPRYRRVAEQLRRELSGMIREEVKDPRLGPVTVTDVSVSKDLAWADVYVSFLGDTEATEERIEVLRHAAGFLRHRLGRLLKMRVVPQLRFHYDQGLDHAQHMDRLIADALESDRRGRGDND